MTLPGESPKRKGCYFLLFPFNACCPEQTYCRLWERLPLNNCVFISPLFFWSFFLPLALSLRLEKEWILLAEDMFNPDRLHTEEFSSCRKQSVILGLSLFHIYASSFAFRWTGYCENAKRKRERTQRMLFWKLAQPVSLFSRKIQVLLVFPQVLFEGMRWQFSCLLD